MALRHTYPRRAAEYGQQAGEVGNETWDAFLARLRAQCKHFRNFDFRMIVAERCVNGGLLQAIVDRRYQPPGGPPVEFGGAGGTLATLPRRISRPGGIACAGRRAPSLEVRVESVLDAAMALQQQGTVQCNKIAVVFPAHPLKDAAGERLGVCLEEHELLGCTNWAEVFLERPARARSGADLQVTPLSETYLEAGSSDVLAAENVWVLKYPGPEPREEPGPWRPVPQELGAAVCFLPRAKPQLAANSVSTTHDRRAAYADPKDRVEYKAQVEAALRVCCLLDCDGVVVGSEEGLCGSEFFGHPIREVCEVWGDVLGEMAGQFRRVAFALGKERPLNLKVTASLLEEKLGARVVH